MTSRKLKEDDDKSDISNNEEIKQADSSVIGFMPQTADTQREVRVYKIGIRIMLNNILMNLYRLLWKKILY